MIRESENQRIRELWKVVVAPKAKAPVVHNRPGVRHYTYCIRVNNLYSTVQFGTPSDGRPP
eukprot:COSAG05_NODE_14_length_36349_cov_27.641655_32_plen_61_part_00